MTLVALLLGIIGGQASTDPAVVCITADTLPVCTGALIGKHTLLTAGHCSYVLGEGVPYFAAFGPDCHAPTQRVRILEMPTHPMYSGEGKPFDLALVKLERDVTVTPLPLSNATLAAGAMIRHVGYGSSVESPMDGWGLQRAVTHAVTRIDADFDWSGDAAANTCLGDSGGPALVDGAIAAVVSDGPDCHSESADVRLDVTRTWVDQTLKGFEPSGCSAASSGTLVFAMLALLRRRPRT